MLASRWIYVVQYLMFDTDDARAHGTSACCRCCGEVAVAGMNSWRQYEESPEQQEKKLETGRGVQTSHATLMKSHSRPYSNSGYTASHSTLLKTKFAALAAKKHFPFRSRSYPISRIIETATLCEKPQGFLQFLDSQNQLSPAILTYIIRLDA